MSSEQIKTLSAYAFASEYPFLPLVDVASINTSGGNDPSAEEFGLKDLSTVSVYPVFPSGDHASGGEYILYNNQLGEAKWWTNTISGSDSSWKLVCNNG